MCIIILRCLQQRKRNLEMTVAVFWDAANRRGKYEGSLAGMRGLGRDATDLVCGQDVVSVVE